MSNWWELYAASIPDGADLVASRDTPGWVRGFFRRADGIGGHAEFAKVDLRGPAAVVAAIGLAVGVVGTVAVVKSASRIQQWWEDQALPAAQTALDRITRQDKAPSQSAMSELVLSESVVENFSNEIVVALEDTRTSMSSAEAQRHLLEILMAASIIADRMRALSNARIEDDAHLPELASAMAKLTAPQVTDTINRMLETNTSLLDDETSAIFAKIFGGGQVTDLATWGAWQYFEVTQ
ncbi:hypothetical protein GXW83_01085 [Streptacidiphilus sp. PB12-B1b]|uniref:hypothetical protein n=1 Tax=Streptacidiphilus sp. PB12-B1b TaxID=2705012 RepID=UPI0015FBF519|nr:hypothetical protein [Streptacidiphilus sp. PB12-B1b]QMU74585.1 hypothetical protein GXW83_01085 [Streptacidiphilus sp. PB12-B1b]